MEQLAFLKEGLHCSPEGSAFLRRVQNCLGPDKKYLVLKANLGNLGDFRPPFLLGEHAGSLIRGAMVLGKLMEATAGYIYGSVRYKAPLEALKKEMDAACEEGFLGKNILDLDFSFDLHVHDAAGQMQSDASSILASLEGGIAAPKKDREDQRLYDGQAFFCSLEILLRIAQVVAGEKDVGQRKLFSVACVGKGGDAVIEAPRNTPLQKLFQMQGMEIDLEEGALVLVGSGPRLLYEKSALASLSWDALEQGGLDAGVLLVIPQTVNILHFGELYAQMAKGNCCGRHMACREGCSALAHFFSSQNIDTCSKETLDQLHMLVQHMQSFSGCQLGKNTAKTLLSIFQKGMDQANGRGVLNV